MNTDQDYNEIFAKKFIELGIAFQLEDDPFSSEFEKFAGDLMSSWVAFSVMHEAPDMFMMMLHNISRMRRIDIVGNVAIDRKSVV